MPHNIGIGLWIASLCHLCSAGSTLPTLGRAGCVGAPQETQTRTVKDFRFGEPSFSSDGRYLALISESFDRVGPRHYGWRLQVYDTSAWKPITLSPNLVPADGHCTAVSWASKGHDFAFAISGKDLQKTEWRISRLTSDSCSVIPQHVSGFCDYHARWSQNLRYLAFDDGAANRVYRYAIETRQISTARIDPPCTADSFDWADNGESIWIASGNPYSEELVSPNDGIYRAYFRDMPATKLCTLPRVFGIYASPDQRWLACKVEKAKMNEGIRSTLVVVETATGAVQELGLVNLGTKPTWRPDGKVLAFHEGKFVRIYDPALGRTVESISLGGGNMQPFWNPGDNSLWIVLEGNKVQRWNGKAWQLMV